MNRLHLHIAVPDLPASVTFYEALFGVAPSVLKSDYAKWLLDDPAVNLAISTRGSSAGIDHVGIQVDRAEDLAALARRLRDAGEVTVDQPDATCCYARSDKTWVRDPAGLAWETFHTFGEATTYGEDTRGSVVQDDAGCCLPDPAATAPSPHKACC